MTYIDLINAFWQEHHRGHFTPGDIALYFVLLDQFNTAGWPAKLPVSNTLLCGLLGCSASMIRSSRDRLERRGVIDFGQAKSKASHSTYRLTLGKAGRRRAGTVNKSAKGCGIGSEKRTESPTVSPTQSGTESLYIRKEEEEEIEKNTPLAPLGRRRSDAAARDVARREFALREMGKRLEVLRTARAAIVPDPAAAEISELYAAREQAKERERQRLAREIAALEGEMDELQRPRTRRAG